jgi:hypothetical protein
MRTFGMMMIGVLAAMGGGLAGCGEVEEPLPTHTIYGAFTSSTVIASGHRAWAKLVGPDGGAADEGLADASCLLSGPACNYSINFIVEGEYTVFAMIDRNDNKAEETGWADSGDLISRGGRPLTLLANTKVNFEDDSWNQVP